jgi:N-acetylglucosaminyl-diphospho-decaprenol L-rhamnosyltransferase
MDAVTVTANSGSDLRKLLACEPLMKSFDRLIVVDNLSTDGSAEMAREEGADVISVSHPSGYGECANLGAAETTGELFAVLNPDITWNQVDVVERLTRHFDQQQVGIVAPALLLPDGRRQDSAREIPTPLDLLLRRRSASQRDRGAIWEPGAVPWVVGACFLARRTAWDAVGGFDAGYFLYFEDVDLCWRLRQAGWHAYLDTDVVVNHGFQAASRESFFSWRTRRHIASAARFYRRNPRFLFSRSLPSGDLRVPASSRP